MVKICFSSIPQELLCGARRLLPLLGEHRSLQVGKIRPKADHFSGFLCPEAFSGAEIADGLQKIGLTLGVIAHDQVHAGVKIQGDFRVIAEIS